MVVMRLLLGMVGRFDRGMLLMAALGLVAAACTDTVLDESSARVIRRGVDTVVRYDTTRMFDTLIVADTLYAADTVVRYDTVIVQRIITRIDTLHLRDTTRIFDTISVRDTIVRYDTLRDSQGQFSVEGWLFKHSALTGKVIDSLPLLTDRASILRLELNDDKIPFSLELRLTLRVARPVYSYNWGEYPLALIYLLVGRMELPLDGRGARMEFTADPRFGASGIAAIPYRDGLWLATGMPGSQGTFSIERVRASERTIDASFKAFFDYVDGVSIDSASMRIRY